MCGNGTCANNIGSFSCECAEGFLPGPNEVCEGRQEWLTSQSDLKHDDDVYESFCRMENYKTGCTVEENSCSCGL